MVGGGRYQWALEGAERRCVFLPLMIVAEVGSWLDPRGE
jgi:hypothetical protein